MGEITCPYCEADFDLNHDDGAYYDESSMEEAQCPDCDKYFMVSSSQGSWYHEGYKADCLNGSEHNWTEWQKLWVSEKGENKGKALMRRTCKDCEKPEQEWQTR